MMPRNVELFEFTVETLLTLKKPLEYNGHYFDPCAQRCIRCWMSLAQIHQLYCPVSKPMTKLEKAREELKIAIMKLERHLNTLEPNKEYWLEEKFNDYVVGFVPLGTELSGEKPEYVIMVKMQGGKTNRLIDIPEYQQCLLLGAIDNANVAWKLPHLLDKVIRKDTEGTALELRKAADQINGFFAELDRPMPPGVGPKGDY